MDNSRLGQLTAELRIRIYELVLTHNEPICIALVHGKAQISPATRPDLSLLAVCRQLWKECSRLFYSSNSFTIKASDRIYRRDAQPLQSFTAFIGYANFASLRTVTVILTTTNAHEVFHAKAVKTTVLWRQLRSLEVYARVLPRLRLICRLSLKLYCNNLNAMMVDLDMEDWNTSVNQALESLSARYMQDGHQPTGETLSAKYLGRILEEYRSIQDDERRT